MLRHQNVGVNPPLMPCPRLLQHRFDCLPRSSRFKQWEAVKNN